MAQAVWKFPLVVTDEQVISVPSGAKILTVQTQKGEPCLWATVDPTNAEEARTILIVGTGHNFDSSGTGYIGTFQQLDGALVFHVFEIDEMLRGSTASGK